MSIEVKLAIGVVIIGIAIIIFFGAVYYSVNSEQGAQGSDTTKDD